MTGELELRRKSSVVFVEVPQFARILNACEAAGRAGVKVRALVSVLMAVRVRGTPSLSYSSTWLVRQRDAMSTATVVVVPGRTLTAEDRGAWAKRGSRAALAFEPRTWASVRSPP